MFKWLQRWFGIDRAQPDERIITIQPRQVMIVRPTVIPVRAKPRIKAYLDEPERLGKWLEKE